MWVHPNIIFQPGRAHKSCSQLILLQSHLHMELLCPTDSTRPPSSSCPPRQTSSCNTTGPVSMIIHMLSLDLQRHNAALSDLLSTPTTVNNQSTTVRPSSSRLSVLQGGLLHQKSPDAHLHSVSPTPLEDSQGIPRPAKRSNFSSMSWVIRGSGWTCQMPERPPLNLEESWLYAELLSDT